MVLGFGLVVNTNAGWLSWQGFLPGRSASAAAVAAEDTLDQALRRYEAARVPRVRRIVAMARSGALSRRSNPATRLLPAALNAKMTALSGGPVLRRITRPVITVPA